MITSRAPSKVVVVCRSRIQDQVAVAVDFMQNIRTFGQKFLCLTKIEVLMPHHALLVPTEYVRTYVRTDGRTDARTDGRTDERTDGRTDEPMAPASRKHRASRRIRRQRWRWRHTNKRRPSSRAVQSLVRESGSTAAVASQ